MLKRSLLLLAVPLAGSYGAIYDQVSKLPTHTFDYIIVGGGTAGNTVANRLTENHDIQVLVLEAGGSNEGVIASSIPLLFSTLSPNTPYDWNYTTAPQSGFNGRTVNYPRGRMLGGSSSINGMVYNTGSKDDWDHISKVTCDPDWTWDAMAKYRDLNQKYVPPNDGHDDTNQYLPSAHSRKGMVPISLPGYSQVIDSRILAAASEFASEFPFQRDMNTGNTIGLGWIQGTIGNGTRSSSATTYVGPDYIHRPNLHILLHAHATKILEATGKNNTTPTFNGVEFGTGPSSPRWQVTAHKEVILSAGVFNTPQLLMLSGIGDPAELASLGIPSRVNLPSVGKNMTDHVGLGNPWEVNNNDTVDSYFSPERFPLNMQEWNETHKGPLSWTFGNQMAWLKLPENDKIIQTHGDPSVGPTSAHFQITWGNGWFMGGIMGNIKKPDGNWMTVFTNLISPTSRGNITLKSTDPFNPPTIDLGYLTTSYDIQTMIYAIKLIKRFVTANAWKGFVISPWGPLGSALNTDEEIVKYIRTYATAYLHAVGTAAMSPRGAQWGVLDPDLRVKGTNGLRVVDASALPYVPTAHTQGPTYLLAEAAAKKIKQGFSNNHEKATHYHH